MTSFGIEGGGGVILAMGTRSKGAGVGELVIIGQSKEGAVSRPG
jgi:hypothetical protein